MRNIKRALRSASIMAAALSFSAVVLSSVFAAQSQRQDGDGAGRQSQQRAEQQGRERAHSDPRHMEMSDQRLEDWIIVRLADRASYTPGIDVNVSDGVVTLSGRVANEEIKRRAMRIASMTSGVSMVRDELTVDPSVKRPETTISDPELAKQVATRIASKIDGAKAGEDWWFDGWRIEGPFNTWNMTVEVDEPGRVVLEGDVPKWDIMRKAVETAASAPGVRVVDSELEYAPNYYPMYRYGEERYYGDGYYPYYPYLARPPYAAPVQPAPRGRAIRPAPRVPDDSAGSGRGTQQRR